MKVMRIFQVIACVAIISSFFISTDRLEAQEQVMRVQIVSVECKKATFGSDEDQIFFRIRSSNLNGGNAKGFQIPDGFKNIKKGETWTPNFQLTLNGHLSIELREHDYLDAPDKIGRIQLNSIMFPSEITQPHILTGDSSHYVVKLTIIK